MAKETLSARLRGLSRRGQRWAPALAWLLVLTFAAWVASDLFWRLTRPASVSALPASESDPHKAARLLADRNPFGSSGAAAVVATGRAAPPAFRLVGVATGFGNDVGFALLQAGNEPPMAVLEGESPAPGVLLRHIHADHVELEVSGVSQTLQLQEPSPAAASGDNPPPPRASSSTSRLHPNFGRPGRLGRPLSE